jgi:molybdopterin/thiamine biosynthesis adenylyltransferase
VVVAGVDNNCTRRLVSAFFRGRGTPVVFSAVNRAADFCWCFVQEKPGPCLGCVFPRVARADSYEPCTVSPAVIDILRVVGGFALHAIDSLVMPRPRHWNFREATLIGPTGDAMYTVEPRQDCGLCGK